MTGQSGFTIVVQVEPAKVELLSGLLDEIGDDINQNPYLRLSRLQGLHFASFVLISSTTMGDAPKACLLFEGNVDGSLTDFLRELMDIVGDGVDKVYSHCVGYPSRGRADVAEVIGYLASHDLGPGAFYVAWPGWSVAEIRREQELRERLGRLLDAEGDNGGLVGQTPEAIRRQLQQLVQADPSLRWAQRRVNRPFLVRYGSRLLKLIGAAPVVVVGGVLVRSLHASPARPARASRTVLSALAVGLGALAGALRSKERAEDRSDAVRYPGWEAAYAGWNDELSGVAQREDVQGQNHLASVTEIKSGWLRMAVLRAVLLGVGLFARLSANKGSLAGIRTIHFARWVVTKDRRLVFLSNFDGSWERYLNDFIDLASLGLTAIWTNTDNEVGFPRTRWLALQGARDEQRFKAFARRSQVRSRTWYSAYPDLTVDNIANNMAVREHLFGPLDESGAEAWLWRI